MATPNKKTETLVGIFLFLGLAMLGTIILLFGNLGEFFKDRYEVTVSFADAPGIIKGSTVRLRGAKIGKVKEKPKLGEDSTIKVVLAINEEQRIEAGSRFQISQASLLGDKEILITPPAVGSSVFIQPGDEVKGAGPGGLDLLQNEAEAIAGNTRKVIEEANTALLKIEASVDEIKAVALKLSTTMNKVNEEVLSSKNVANFGGTLANLEQASASFARLGEDLEPAVNEMRLAVAEVRETNRTVKSAVAKVEPALDEVPQVLNSIDETAKTATAALAKVDDKKGALGALVADEELKTDMKDFMRNLKTRGILRYKDEDEKEEDPRDRFRGRRR